LGRVRKERKREGRNIEIREGGDIGRMEGGKGTDHHRNIVAERRKDGRKEQRNKGRTIGRKQGT
jgi:hypothetical protein